MIKIKELLSKKNNNLIFILAILGIVLVFISSLDLNLNSDNDDEAHNYEA